MEQISAGFNDSDSMRDIFVKYKDAFGRLFMDGSRFLCDRDYQCLYRNLARVAEWDKAQLMPNTYTYSRFENMIKFNDEGGKKFFFRVFGIYLREATFRYSGDFTEVGAFWENLKKGVLNDLQDAFQRFPGQEQRIRIDNRGETFWASARDRAIGSASEKSIQNELTRYNGYLIRHTFDYFDNFFSKVSNYETSNVYVKHLTKIAGCPLNFNPVRNSYNELRVKRTRNSIEEYVNTHGSAALDYAPAMRSLLIDRICDFFDFLGDLDATNLKDAKIELTAWCGITNTDHYYYSWLEEEFHQGKDRIRRNRGSQSIQREYQNTDFNVIFNTLNNKVSIMCPEPAYVTHILRENGLEQKYEYYVVSDGEELFKIGPYGHIAGQQTITSDEFNRNIFKLFSCDQIQFCDEDGNDSRPIKNPWMQKVSLFDDKGRPSNSANSTSYLVLQPQENVQEITGGCCKTIEDAMGGMNVYKIIVDDVAEHISIKTNSQTLYYDVQDSRYLRLYQDKKDRKDVFIHQKPHVKFGIGSVQFSNPGEDGFQAFVPPVWTHKDYDVVHKRLIITNKSNANKACYIQEQAIGERIAPQTVILPSNWEFWMSKDDNHFYANLKTTNGAQIPDKYWNKLSDNLYQYKVDNYEEWKNNGFPIQFFCDKDISFYAKCPYFNANDIKGWANANFFLGANPFDDVIPKGGKFYFRWSEGDCSFEIKVDYDNASLRQCLKSFGLWGNLPELTFGWSYENTSFTEVFSKSSNYHLPRRPEKVIGMTIEEREKWLQSLLDNPIESTDSLIPYNRFGAEMQREIKEDVASGFFRDYQDSADILQELSPRFYEKYVPYYREDLRDNGNNLKELWQKKWAELDNNEHNELVDSLKNQIQTNGLECDLLNDCVFLWSFVDEADIQHFIGHQLKKKKELQRKINREKAKSNLADFIAVWNKSRDENLKKIPLIDLLLGCSSFGECSKNNFKEYARYLNSWLCNFVDCIDDFRSCPDMVIPEDFFVEDTHNKPIISGGMGYTQNQVKELSRMRIDLYNHLKSENERYGEKAVDNSEMIEKVMLPIRFKSKSGSILSFASLQKSDVFCINGTNKGRLWLQIIRKAWAANGRFDLCHQLDVFCESPNFQNNLRYVGQSPIESIFHGMKIDDELVKLANHLRKHLLPLFEKEERLWKNAKIGHTSLKNVELPPEVFIHAPINNYADYIKKLAKSLAEKLRHLPGQL